MRQEHSLCPQFEGEENPVTFQIAMVGADGIVVGSDRKCTFPTRPGFRENPAHQSFEANKYAENEKLVCFFAGSPVSSKLAREFTSKYCGDFSSTVEWENDTVHTAEEITRSYNLPLFEELIIVRNEVRDRFWLLRKFSNASAHIEQVMNYVCTGDNSPARFLPAHLYSRSRICELRTLALLTLCYASEENPTGVGLGFDIMCLTADGKRAWSSFEASDVVGLAEHKRFSSAFRKAFDRLGKKT